MLLRTPRYALRGSGHIRRALVRERQLAIGRLTMPYSKDPTTYASEYKEIFEKAKSERIELEFLHSSQATSLRHILYAYRRAAACRN